MLSAKEVEKEKANIYKGLEIIRDLKGDVSTYETIIKEVENSTDEKIWAYTYLVLSNEIKRLRKPA